MKFSFWLTLLLFISSFSERVVSQVFFQSLTYPRSIVASAMGEQGAAFLNTSDAMQYNPANLVYSENGSFSFFRNSFMDISTIHPSLTSETISLRFPNGMCGAFEYTNRDFGTFESSTWVDSNSDGLFNDGDVSVKSYHIYESSIAGGFAMPLGSEWSTGVQLRYAWEPFPLSDEYFDHLLFGAGVSYVPAALSERAIFGLSFMNFGTPFESSDGSSSEPMPAQINLASQYSIVRNDHFDVTLALGFSKPLDKFDPGFNSPAQSSFRSLFTDWSDFPEDVATHIGLGYRWKPLELGRDISFFQEMYLGYFTVGASPSNRLPLDRSLVYTSHVTHGVRIGIERKGVKFSASYAGRWHEYSVTYNSLLPVSPYEMFQFNISTDWNPLSGPRGESHGTDRLEGVLFSAGYAYCAQVGRMKGNNFYGAVDAFSQPSLWSMESDFYMSDNSALIASLGYARMTESLRLPGSNDLPWGYNGRTETVALESGYRYHPIEQFHPFFVQASLGIMWLNPMSNWLRLPYFYKTFDDLAVGCVIPVWQNEFNLIPSARFRTLFMETTRADARLCGYSQFEFGLNVGYRL
jgi:hypothetical protein